MINKSNSRTYAYLLSRGHEFDKETSAEDIVSTLGIDASMVELYKKVIQMISNGMSYNEIFMFIDAYDKFVDEELTDEEKERIKRKVKNVINVRKNIDEKGEDKNE